MVSMVSNLSASCSLNNAAIKTRIVSGEFKISDKRGRSKVWNTFNTMQNGTGVEFPNVVVCRSCLNIYKYNQKTTSNLVKHKCYFASTNESSDAIQKIDVDAETKTKAIRTFTEWTISNCRPFKIVEDSGLKKVAELLLSIGEKREKMLMLKSFLPHPSTISRIVTNIYNSYLQKIKSEVELINNAGYGLTSDLWTDNFIKKSYIAVTIHYIKDGSLVIRLLGMKSMEGEKFTSEKILSKVQKLLKVFDMVLDEKAIMVTDRGANMVAAFGKYNHIYCIDHLLNNILQKSMKDVSDVSELCRLYTKLVKYFKASGINSTLSSTLKSFSSTRWNTIYYVFVSIERNRAEIVQILQEKNDLSKIHNINLNHISAIIKILEPFEETFKKLEGDNYVTIHLTYIYVHSLKKNCVIDPFDLEIIKELKASLIGYLDTVVLNNLTIFHKIALFLFPPANKLIQFTENDKKLLKDECKNIMKSYLTEVSEAENESEPISEFSKQNNELFSDFVQQPEILNSTDRINKEILMHESINTILYDDFNILQWWELHKNEFPLLYKTSYKILATSATSASSERVFSAARNLISEKRSR